MAEFIKPNITIGSSTVNVQQPTSTTTNSTTATKEELEKEYIAHSSVTLGLVENYSLYRKVNLKALSKRVDYIGSSVNSSRILSSNKEEVEKYFPNIIGISPNNDQFVKAVKVWLNNIRVAVSQTGTTLDTSFRYNRYADYLNVKAREEEIEKEYNLVSRNNLEQLQKALNIKIKKLNELESEKCRYGSPINVEEYLIYRHCLLYKDIAKDQALINSDAAIRFYIKDDAKEQERIKKYREQIVKAKANYVTAIADKNLFDAVYIQYCINRNLPVIESLGKDEIDRQIELDKFSQEEPVKFNKIFNDKDVTKLAQIEMLIARGELFRSEYNQQVTTADGIIIGANMTEALAWWKNPEHTSVVNAYLAKLTNA